MSSQNIQLTLNQTPDELTTDNFLSSQNIQLTLNVIPDQMIEDIRQFVLVKGDQGIPGHDFDVSTLTSGQITQLKALLDGIDDVLDSGTFY